MNPYVRRCLPGAVFIGFFAFTTLHSAPHLTGGDCGEYVTAGSCLGNTHPPGNPIYQMLSFLAQQVPAGDAFSRSAALSGLAAAGGVALACALLLSLGCGPLSSAGFPLLLGFSPVVMRNALVTEVYTVLFFFCVVVSCCFLRLRRTRAPGDPEAVLLLAFAAGLLMGVHYLSLFYLAPLLLGAWWHGGRSARTAIAAAALFLCGFAVMLYLPARSLSHPPANFGIPSTPAAFLRSTLWALYAPQSFQSRSVATFLHQSAWGLKILAASLSPLIVPLAILGAAGARRRFPGVFSLLAGGGLYLGANIVLQNYASEAMARDHLQRFLGLTAVPLYLLAGVGADDLLRLLRARSTPVRAPAAAAALLLAAAVAVTGWRSAQAYSRAGDFVVRDYYREAFLSLPPNAAIVLDDDTGVFSGLSLHFVERLRTDLLPVDRTESYLADIYRNPTGAPESTGPSMPDRVRKEIDFVRAYHGAVAFVRLPEWTRYLGGSSEYGRIFLAKTDPAGSPYRFPVGSPIRYGDDATGYDRKTREVLVDALYKDFLRASPSLSAFEARLAGIAGLVRDQAPYFTNFASLLVDLGRMEEAERILGRALEVNPDEARGLELWGVVMSRTGRPEEARRIFSDPRLADSADAQLFLGNYFNQKRDPAEAVTRYERAVMLGMRTPAVFNNLGVAYVRLGNREKARESFQEALRLNPEYAGALGNLARLTGAPKR